MSDKLYPSLRESDYLDLRLKVVNSFNISFQNLKDFFNHEAIKYKTKCKTYKDVHGLIQSIDGVLLLGVSRIMYHVKCYRSWTCCGTNPYSVNLLMSI